MDLEGKYIASRYEILEKIGNGGMATVYKAKCHVLNRFVAVKVLKDEFTTDDEFIRRFNTEAQSAAALTHPNIVSIYDVGHEDNIYYIVMELIQGKTLKQIIIEDGVLPWKWAVNIATQIASALEAAHKKNIIHRDIKPHNIIITEDGVAKVTDFGIAKAVSNSTITAFGTTIGSVHYFSPEHARGGFTDAKSDLYSLGIVMYEMVTGKVPFDADTPVSVALKHMQEKAVEPIKLNPSVPLAVNQIIVKAMQKEPSFRYQSATEMLKDLTLAVKNPDGLFIQQRTIDMNKTQVLGAITDDMITDNKKENNNEERNNKKKKQNKISQFLKKYPAIKIALLVISCILIFVLALFGTKALMDAGTIKDVNIPKLVGLTEQEVIETLKNSKFTYEIISEEYNSEVETGKVISQNPAYRENFKVKENTNIQVVVSKGLELTIVPKVVGMEYDKAVEELNKNKLQIERIEETSDKIQEGYVIKQEPAENTEALAGDTIKVYVSIGTGIEQVSVTSVVGKTEDVAKKELEDAKLKVEIVYEEDKTKSDGVVLRQSIEVGKVVDEGTSIILTINKIAQMKTGTVNVNLKSLLNYTPQTSAVNEQQQEVPSVNVEIMVDNDIVYRERKRKDTTKISVPVDGIGIVTIKVKVDDVVKGTQTLDLNSSNPVVNFE